MRILIFTGALLGLSGVAQAAAEPPGALAAGDWRLSEVGGKIACTLTLTRQTSVAGFEVKAPLACRLAFPALKAVAAWNLDAKGGLVLSDAEAHPIIVFPAQQASSFQAKAPDGRTWRLDPLGETEGPAAEAAPPMAGAFRLNAADGASLCDLTFTSDEAGARGAITPGVCSPAWTDRGLSAWSMRGSKLTLHARDGTKIVFFKSVQAGVFVNADPKADAISLSHR